MSIKRVLIIAIILGIAVTTPLLFLSDRDRVALIDATGEIDSPSTRSLLGVKLGMTETEASDVLYKRGKDGVQIDFIVADNNISCLGKGKIGQRLMLYYDSTWRRGAICFAIDHGRVDSIRWLYNFLAI